MSVSTGLAEDCKSWDSPVAVSPKDRKILRDLAKYLAEASALPIQEERADLWKRHNMLHPTRPLILARPENGWHELVPGETLQCEREPLRDW